MKVFPVLPVIHDIYDVTFVFVAQVFEQCTALQKEIAMGVQELVKCQKTYNDDEHVAHEARVKASDADSKYVIT